MNNTIYIDDLPFVPYLTMGGLQAKITLKNGVLSVRRGGHGLIVSSDKPYEVWYPDRDCPDGYQTADDIWDYIKKQRKG